MNDDDKLQFEATEGIEPLNSFDRMGIKDDLLRGIYAYGFEKPSAIQQRAVMPIIQGRDVIAQAQSGTGKSSMISLAVCQMVDTSTREYVFFFNLLLLSIGPFFCELGVLIVVFVAVRLIFLCKKLGFSLVMKVRVMHMLDLILVPKLMYHTLEDEAFRS